MFAEWRLTLRKAEHALKMGQLEEAGQFVTARDVRSHRAARELKGEVVAALAKRAAENLRRGDSQRAWEDLTQAERLAGPDPRLDEVRQELTRQCLAEAMEFLSSGRPEASLACLRQLSQRGVNSAECRRLDEAAAAWQTGQSQVRAGRFTQAVKHYAVARGLLPDCEVLANCLQEAEAAREKIGSLEAELHRAMATHDWDAALLQANAILALAPEHAPARAARRRAWQVVGAPTSEPERRRPIVTAEARGDFGADKTVIRTAGSPLVDDATGKEEGAQSGQRFLLWIDAVGGYLVCLGDRVSIGQPAGWHVDVPVMADLSRLHAWIERDGEGYLLRAVRPATVSGQSVREKATLVDGSPIVLGDGVRFRFRQPNQLSTTARLELESPHRLSLAADTVLLMAETCIVGPNTSSHVVAPDWKQELVLYRQGQELWCRASGDFEVDGQLCHGRGRLTLSSRIKGDGFSLALEPLVS